jgi:hypothetical protein
MKGLGFLIWQLANMPPIPDLVRLLTGGGVRWVSIKTIEGGIWYNAKGGNQKLLKTYWNALKAAGISVGFWHYVYGEQPGLEGDKAAEFCQEFDPDHILIDAEGPYKKIGAARKVKTYLDKLPNKVPAYLCSYKAPSKHGPFATIPGFPFSAFMNHEKVKGAAPQVYWIGTHDPAEQVQRSYEEYKKLSSKEFIPIGSSFGAGTWEPTKRDLATFRDWVQRIYPAYGFYSLDWIIRKGRMDLYSVITQTAPPVPPPAELSDHEKITRVWQYAQEQEWDV